MRLYYFTTAEHGLAAIRDQRLKVSEIHTLNDPFEFLSPDLRDPEIRSKLTTLKNRTSQQLGIVCFSKNWQHPMMWGHYAASHQGICLGFDVKDSQAGLVDYVSERATLTLQDVRDGNPDKARILLQKLLLTKFQCWSYEEEYRVFCRIKNKDRDPVNQLFFLDFSDELKLTQVIVGSTSNLTRSRVQSALGELRPHVEQFKARPAFKKFEVVRNTNELLWK